MTHNQPQQQPQDQRTPAAKPRTAAPGHRDYSPVQFVFRDIPLRSKTRILAGDKHLLRRLNNTTHVSDGAPNTYANTLRRHKIRAVMTITVLAPLGFTVPAHQNLTEMPINHQSIRQRLPTSLLRRNISDQKTERTDRPTPFSEVTRKPHGMNIRSKDVWLLLRGHPPETVAQRVAVFGGFGPG